MREAIHHLLPNIPYQALPILTSPYQAIPSPTKPYQAIPTHTKPYQALPSPTKPYQAIPSSTLPFFTLHCPIPAHPLAFSPTLFHDSKHIICWFNCWLLTRNITCWPSLCITQLYYINIDSGCLFILSMLSFGEGCQNYISLLWENILVFYE